MANLQSRADLPVGYRLAQTDAGRVEPRAGFAPSLPRALSGEGAWGCRSRNGREGEVKSQGREIGCLVR
jgi:hypothetical protein